MCRGLLIISITGCLFSSVCASEKSYNFHDDASWPVMFFRSEPESEIQIIENIQQFITHIESKKAKYQSMLQQIEQKQARDREGTKEKWEAERAKGGPQADGIPAYVSYEKDKAKLRKKIQNAENKLSILQSCSGRSNKKRRCAS